MGAALLRGDPVVIVLPSGDPSMDGHAAVLRREKAEFEALLGASVEVRTCDPGRGSRWLLLPDGAHAGPATLTHEAEADRIVSRGGTFEDVWRTLNLLPTLVRRGGGTVADTPCASVDEVIDRVIAEVGDTYPSFALRGLDWPAICARHAERVRGADDPLAGLREWLAELHDVHTWATIAPRPGNLPYAVRVAGDAAVFTRVPAGTAAHEAGVRPGWRLTGVDAAGWWRRTSAPAHARALVAGLRLLAGPVGQARRLTAVSPDARRVTWSEAPVPGPPGDPVKWRRLSGGAGYLRVAAWSAGAGVDDAFDAAFGDLRGCDRLILDLRGNTGGNLVLACRTRDRFLRTETTAGTIRHSSGAGRLGPPVAITATPAAPARRWPGRLVVLTDPLTCSASEDFLLGLQGLDYVRVVGEPSCGGSGRPRTLRLLPQWQLTISSALTYDRRGRCVEGAGIPVDVPVVPPDPRPDAPDLTLAAAESI